MSCANLSANDFERKRRNSASVAAAASFKSELGMSTLGWIQFLKKRESLWEMQKGPLRSLWHLISPSLLQCRGPSEILSREVIAATWARGLSVIHPWIQWSLWRNPKNAEEWAEIHKSTRIPEGKHQSAPSIICSCEILYQSSNHLCRPEGRWSPLTSQMEMYRLIEILKSICLCVVLLLEPRSETQPTKLHPNQTRSCKPSTASSDCKRDVIMLDTSRETAAQTESAIERMPPLRQCEKIQAKSRKDWRTPFHVH